MRRTLNVKFLVCLLVITAVLGGGMALAHHLQYKQIPVALLKQAQRAEDDGDLKRVDKYLSRYLEFVPDDIEQRARLARVLSTPKLLVNYKDMTRAFLLLEDVLARDTTREDLRRLTVPLALRLKRMDDAAGHLKLLPMDGETAALWAQWHEAKGQPDEAIPSYREAVERLPKNVDNCVRLARLLRSRTWDRESPTVAQKQRDADAREADLVIDKMVQANAGSWQARLGRWNYYRDFVLKATNGAPRGGWLEALRFQTLLRVAEQDVGNALDIAEGEPDVRLAAAEAAQLGGQLDVARVHLDKALQLHRSDPQLYRAYARLELQIEGQTKDPEARKTARAKAEAWLRRGIQELKAPAVYEVLWSHASLLIEGGEIKELGEAEKIIRRMRDANFAPAGVDFLQGRLLFARQQWPEAAQMLERCRPLLENSGELPAQADLLLGRCYAELDQPERQFAVYERLAKRNPNSLTARAGMADAARRLGRVTEALKLFDQILRLPDAPAGMRGEQIRLLMVQAQQRNRDGDWQAVEKVLDDLAAGKQLPAVDLAVLRAEYLVLRDRADQARKVIEEARKQDPNEVDLWTAQATLAQRLGQPDEALRLLDDAEKSLKEPRAQVEIRLARAACWVQRRNDQTKLELDKIAATADGLPAADRSRLLNGLAEAYYRAGQSREAARIWQSLTALDEFRKDLRVRLVLFDLAHELGDDEAMTRLLGEIRSLEGPDGAFSKHSEAVRLVWLARQNRTGDKQREETLSRAARLLDELSVSRPTWSPALLVRAEIENIRGNPDRAVESYRAAMRLGDRNPLVIRQLVETLRKQQKYREADQVLRNLTNEELARADLERQAARISLLNRNPDRAVELALNAVRNDSHNYKDHLWLGRVLSAAGPARRAQAEQHLRRAAELAPNEPEPWVAMVQTLAAQKRTLEAPGFLEQAREKVRPEKRAQALAQCYDALGKTDEARKHFDEAVRQQSDDADLLIEYAGFHIRSNRIKEAEEIIRRLLEGAIKLNEEQAEWAHTRLALLLADNDHERFKEALPHVGLRLDESGAIVADASVISGDSINVKRAAVRVLASQSQWQCRLAAIKRFEELDSRGVLTADDRYRFAQLYETADDWTKARDQLRQASTADDCTAEHMIGYVQSLLRRREIEEANRILGKLEPALTGKGPQAELALLDLKVRWLEANDQGNKAVSLLNERLQKAGADPQEILLLVSSLGRQKRFSEAVQLIDRIWQSCPPEAAGGTSVALLRTTKTGEEVSKKVEQRLRDAVAKAPKSAALVVQLGDVQDLRGYFQEAEQLYRDALKIEPGNVVALNNLAWLLSQRSQKGEEALDLINRAIRSVGPRGELLDTRAVVYLNLNRPNDAIVDLKDAMTESMTAPRCFHLAQAYQKANNRDEAVKALRKANELGLQAAQLHPVEQVAHRKLHEELNQR